MAYCVEGENNTPEEFESDPRWKRAFQARKAAYPKIQHAASTPLPAPPAGSTGSASISTTPAMAPLACGRPKRHAPLPKLPKTDLKIIFRHGGGLCVQQCNGRVLLPLVCAAARIDYNTARQQDKLRPNPFNSSFLISTPAEVPAKRYVAVDSLQLGTVKYPLRAYVAAPDDAVRGITHNALYNQTEDEIIQDLQAMNKSSQYTITDARPLGKTRVDVCPHPKSNRCPRCGVEHQLVEPPTCTARCILCGEAHFTVSKKCKVRFDRTGKNKSPPATGKVDMVTEKKVNPDSTPRRSSRSRTRLPSDPQKKTGRASRSRTQSRSRSRFTTGRGRTRSRSTSYPPLPGAETQSTKPVSWGPRSPSLVRENKELRAQLQKQRSEIAELREQIQ
ncbi:hypothetical protein HPB49_002717 [Dermacentor silvarum]|uniref:Uncharacterized protein n=1 Tax=Dermacentor silvarum TaxID=543639 RepID=A0ACB8DAG0_DERSI|nr:hypothetical protein HPB49_002717 [Dermacentor silvarum]